MVNVFCSKKLEPFVDIDNNIQETLNLWNAHLVYFDGKKCLYFVDKKTLYSIFIADIVKKDLKNIGNLFFDTLVQQLKNDKIYRPELDKFLIDNFKTIKFYKTDNDQKTLGTLRDDLNHLKAYCEDKNNKLLAALEFAKISMNGIPIGVRKYYKAKELMEEELKNHA